MLLFLRVCMRLIANGLILKSNLQKNNKPIIAVEPWGSERTSVVVKNAANAIVGWNAKSVANAVRNDAIYQLC